MTQPVEPTNPNSVGAARLLPGDEYLLLPQAPQTWLIEPVLPSGGSLLLYGDPKVGKSFAALQLACALAGPPETDSRGVASSDQPEWLGWTIPHPARVAYIQLDTPRSLWTARIVALRDAGLPTGSVVFGDRETYGDCFPFSILNPLHEAILASSLQAIAPDVVIIDTLRETCTGSDENDSTEMQAVIAHLTAACQPAALVLVHHAKKPPSEGEHSLISGTRGSSYVTGKMDAICRFSSNSMTVIGRSVEETTVGLEKVEIPGGFLWKLDSRAESVKLARLLLADSSLPTLRSKARRMAELTNKEEGACYSQLQRLSKASDSVPDSLFSNESANESGESVGEPPPFSPTFD